VLEEVRDCERAAYVPAGRCRRRQAKITNGSKWEGAR